ncbi:MAG: winged helix-turn-helix transcriptional regulator [Chloroflexi bacterium AL-W]|nr:winged helix-turn-helix transcriptional regulator [Chloroflexi bacterium AL-N1]NOK68818.1 winged helix-turn-helix transcriptional regulator [Chloroflexi bacterium AL-N10]NOK76304.1 winged helix-turn-helix transcriptional regulator [Chloroflexi bacterium AL-N5]NOK84059.1 winged helix-turn-helix transcriptional regulator [Chloroflexi bacterium AL-W]NOK91442.1 winged helix-turn-helix transcriptional regulator [Chloroflexi bacterium AL-N15]
MSSYEDRLTEVEQQVTDLLQRVDELEQQAATSASPPQPTFQIDPTILGQMRNREGPPYEEEGTRGAVTYAGALHTHGAQYEWQIERPAPGLLQLEPEPLAHVLAALGSPQRLLLVRALLSGPRNRQQLQEALDVTSAGQLYHHLKELLAVGIIEQRGRNDYRLEPRKVIPFLTLLAIALDLTNLK